ncbi:MAG: hypothetical protein CMM87_00725 [Rickettsiales bacterium]|mgnify:CR=1 FL=1|nr:hypothetical protein [Rickettsiales bacterium]|tara:strand:- start:43471 stop:43926 length:456 start_codon:yes stop_codon:yes gene_type:complete
MKASTKQNQYNGDFETPITCHSLSEIRKKKKLSTLDVAEHLRISKAYIDAIEKHDFQSLPSTTYTLGFIRTLAKFYGIDPIETSNVYKQKISEHGISLEPDHELNQVMPIDKPSSNYIYIGILLTATTLALGYYLFSYQQDALNDLKNFLL